MSATRMDYRPAPRATMVLAALSALGVSSAPEGMTACDDGVMRLPGKMGPVVSAWGGGGVWGLGFGLRFF
jgi:hypothetical protein